MITGIIGILIGASILGAGIYYLVNDKEENSKKIYGTISVIGVIVILISLLMIL